MAREKAPLSITACVSRSFRTARFNTSSSTDKQNINKTFSKKHFRSKHLFDPAFSATYIFPVLFSFPLVLLLTCVSCDQSDHADVLRLTDSMRTCFSLKRKRQRKPRFRTICRDVIYLEIALRIPIAVEEDDRIRSGQVETLEEDDVIVRHRT